MRFIHTGDIHWGMTPDADKPWGKETGPGHQGHLPLHRGLRQRSGGGLPVYQRGLYSTGSRLAKRI